MWYVDAIYFWQQFDRTVLRHSAAWSSHRMSFVVHCVGSENWFLSASSCSDDHDKEDQVVDGSGSDMYYCDL